MRSWSFRSSMNKRWFLYFHWIFKRRGPWKIFQNQRKFDRGWNKSYREVNPLRAGSFEWGGYCSSWHKGAKYPASFWGLTSWLNCVRWIYLKLELIPANISCHSWFRSFESWRPVIKWVWNDVLVSLWNSSLHGSRNNDKSRRILDKSRYMGIWNNDLWTLCWPKTFPCKEFERT